MWLVIENFTVKPTALILSSRLRSAVEEERVGLGICRAPRDPSRLKYILT